MEFLHNPYITLLKKRVITRPFESKEQRFMKRRNLRPDSHSQSTDFNPVTAKFSQKQNFDQIS